MERRSPWDGKNLFGCGPKSTAVRRVYLALTLAAFMVIYLHFKQAKQRYELVLLSLLRNTIFSI
jgi:hypothetical protein